MNKETQTTFKFSDKNIAKLKPKSKPVYYFDTYQECLVCIVQPTGTKTFYYRFKDENKKIKHKKVFRFVELSPQNNVDVARLKVQEWIKTRKNGGEIKIENPSTVEHLAKRFLAEALDGYRVSHLIGKSPLAVKYEEKTKREIRSYIKNYILLKTKDPELKKVLTRKLSQTSKNFKDHLLEKVNSDHVRDIMIRLSQQPYSANRLKAWVSTMFEWGIYKKICQHNPCIGVGKNIERKIKTYLPIEDVKRIYSYINTEGSLQRNSHFKVMVGLSLDTGIRLKHLFEIRWKEPKTQKERDESRGWVDFKNKKIRIHRAKNKKEFNFDLANEGVSWLEKLRELLHTKNLAWALKSQWVFPKPNTKEDKPFDYDSYKGSLRVMIKHLKLPDDFQLKYARKTYATHTGRKHGLEITARKMGHSDTRTTAEHYHTPNDDELLIQSTYGEVKNDDVQLHIIRK